MKRVHCLYRVSTNGQVEKDDIPMQKQSCREFAEMQGWEIKHEYYEKGVSGFKVTAANRDAIQELKEDVIKGKFDILLVFMFDRIGRIESETPFVVEWLVQHGIEVWSVNEGQQRFDNHVDKLMNYIRFWQASGESIKTSIRTKTRLGQIVQEGRYRGGKVPYGYQIEKQGRMNKKNHEVYEIFVDEGEAAVVRMMFDRYVNAGYGSRKIATYVSKQGYLNKSGKKFHGSSVLNMLKNPMYRGVLRSGETYSEPFPHLRIVDDDIFDRAQKMIAERGSEYDYKCAHPKVVRGNCLLSGNVYCAHCGGRLIASTGQKIYIKQNGEVVDKHFMRYVCYNKTRDKDSCPGQVTYRSHFVDNVIDELMEEFFSRLKGVSYNQVVERQFKSQLKTSEANLSKAKALHNKRSLELADLKTEVINTIRGTGKWNADLLNELIQKTEADVKEAAEQVEKITNEITDSAQMLVEVKKQYQRLLNWADLYAGCSIDEKKMIISNIISKVHVGKGNALNIEFNITIGEFIGEENLTELMKEVIA